LQNHQVTDLFIYPIKSLGGISLDQCEVLPEGFKYDRRWMLVDDAGNFLTQREHTQIALFSCAMGEDRIEVRYKEERQEIPLTAVSPHIKQVKVWSSQLKAQEVDPLLSEWFSDHLGMSATLVKMTEISQRPKQLSAAPFKTALSFADGYPYLIMGKASMAALNDRLESRLPLDRFRANIIISTKDAHEEDNWTSDFTLGTAKMKVIKPCARCVVTTIDQQSGDKGKEPLKTLATYRKWDNKIWFGANAICLEPGNIKVGDRVESPT